MKSFMKKAVASVLVMALCLGGVSVQKQGAKAAENYVTVINTPAETAPAGNVVSKAFTLPLAGDLGIAVFTWEKCDFNYEITDNAGNTVFGPKSVTASDSGWDIDGTGYLMYIIVIGDATAGNYNFRIVFSENQEFSMQGLLYPSATAVAPSLDRTSLTITKGFKDKVTVVNAGGATITYKSSNTKVATVDAKGTVTAKTKGSATITVTTSTGYTGTCKVTVKDNVYSVSKLPLSQATPLEVTPNVYNISYDKKGNLVIKLRLINRFGRTAKYLKPFKVTVKNEKGKVIGTYSVKKKTINLRTNTAKAYTFTIKKSKLKIKTAQDLRYCKPSVDGTFYYSIR